MKCCHSYLVLLVLHSCFATWFASSSQNLGRIPDRMSLAWGNLLSVAKLGILPFSQRLKKIFLLLYLSMLGGLQIQETYPFSQETYAILSASSKDLRAVVFVHAWRITNSGDLSFESSSPQQVSWCQLLLPLLLHRCIQGGLRQKQSNQPVFG